MVLRNRSGIRISAILLLVFQWTVSYGQNIDKMIVKEMENLWEQSVEKELVTIDVELHDNLLELHEGDVIYKLESGDGKELVGYLLLTSAMGRFDEFDYFIIYDTSPEVRVVRVTVYRSSHGGAICNKRWLDQFTGYMGSELTYGKDVQSVTGATISGGSIVEDIQRTYRLITKLKEREVL